jgi:chromosome segregation ATPase
MEVKSEFNEYEKELGETAPAIIGTEQAVLDESFDASSLTKEQRVQLATLYTTQIKVSTFQMALALASIRRMELHKELGFNSFYEFAKIECNISKDRALELVEAINEFGAGDKIKQLMDASPSKFLQVSKEIRKKKMNGEVLVLASGEEISATEYLEERISEELAELRKKNKALNRELENSKSDIADAQGKIKTLKEKVKSKEGEVENLKQSKDIDPLKLQSIKEQRELERVIDDQNDQITKALKNLTEIPEDARNNSLGIYLMRTIATMEIQLKALRVDWSAFIIQESR